MLTACVIQLIMFLKLLPTVNTIILLWQQTTIFSIFSKVQDAKEKNICLHIAANGCLWITKQKIFQSNPYSHWIQVLRNAEAEDKANSLKSMPVFIILHDSWQTASFELRMGGTKYQWGGSTCLSQWIWLIHCLKICIATFFQSFSYIFKHLFL